NQPTYPGPEPLGLHAEPRSTDQRKDRKACGPEPAQWERHYRSIQQGKANRKGAKNYQGGCREQARTLTTCQTSPEFNSPELPDPGRKRVPKAQECPNPEGDKAGCKQAQEVVVGMGPDVVP